ncbi:uncharacterized protein LOC106639485 [Copidosoma floridanum]|uniref:uncharacterized protein LOC106639485 n=1 Tax=Copidosoma floridanum TaxID=29053 RepID=UPI0006C96742|nr:uncharacterized protein LOC106639485 [Copidosoma floridanum]
MTLSLFSVGQLNLSRGNGDLILQKTQLGWIVGGGIGEISGDSAVSCNLIELTRQMEKFWVIEDIGSKSSKSIEETRCEAHYVEHTTRDKDSRYIVKLPFKRQNEDFGDSRPQALQRLNALQTRLNSNPELKVAYERVMNEYIKLGHMSLVRDESPSGYYMPHHPIIKESSSTTKVRVVFDASAKASKGFSLNKVLMVGPTIQSKLFDHLLRFRTY